MTGATASVIMSAWKIQEEYAEKDSELNRQKQTLKEQQQQRLTVTYNGGISQSRYAIIILFVYEMC